MNIAKICCMALCAAGLSFAASATHDGFFLNFGVGLSYTDMDYEMDDESYDDGSLSGLSTILDIRIGGNPIENLAISFDMTGVSLSDPKAKTDGGYSGTVNGDINISAYGIGVTWFLSDLNAYGSGSFYFGGQENLDMEGLSGTIDGSLKGFALRVGKEWWVSDIWGLGAQLQYNRLFFETDTDVSETDDFGTFGVLFSATFN